MPAVTGVAAKSNFQPMKLEGLSLIGQSRVSAAGKPTAAINPATGAAIGPDYFEATTADVDAAAQLADQAFSEFSRWSGPRRAGFMKRIAELLEANGPAIIERVNRETALPAARLQGELARTCFQLRLYGDAAASGLFAGARIDHADPNRKPLPKPGSAFHDAPAWTGGGILREQFPARLLGGGRRYSFRLCGGLSGHRQTASRSPRHFRNSGAAGATGRP